MKLARISLPFHHYNRITRSCVPLNPFFFFYFFFIFFQNQVLNFIQCDIGDQFSHHVLEGRPGSLEMFSFPFSFNFCKPVIIHLVYIVSLYSSADSGPSYGILDLADVANIFQILFRRMSLVMHLKVLSSVALNRRL